MVLTPLVVRVIKLVLLVVPRVYLPAGCRFVISSHLIELREMDTFLKKRHQRSSLHHGQGS